MRHAGTIVLSLFALSPAWEHEFLFPSMTFHKANAFDIVCQLDRNDTLDEVPQNKKQKISTGLLLDKLHKQDFVFSRFPCLESLRTDQSSWCC